jgi:ParB-like chromosome segregation protein Spo0J
MRAKGTKLVNPTDLQTNLFVREELNQDHVMALAMLIEAGVEMNTPIEIGYVTSDPAKKETVVDGRHRKEAYELNDVKKIDVKVLEFEDEIEMISYAYKRNAGGSKPPTIADTEHTVGLLLQHNETMKRIGELLGLPASIARKLVNNVKSRMNRQQIQHAIAAITDSGLTVSKAAELFGVDAEMLKEILSGKRRKHRKGVADLQRVLTSNSKSTSLKSASIIKKLLQEYEDGDVTQQQVRDIFKHIEDLQKGASRGVADWKKRFEAMSVAKKTEVKAA